MPRDGIGPHTVSSPPEVASVDTLNQLEFHRTLERVAAHAVSELGAESVLARRPSADARWIREELADVNLFRQLLVSEKAVAPVPIRDVTLQLQRLHMSGSVLEGAELFEIGAALGLMHTVRSGLVGLRDESPRVADLAVELPPRAIDAAIERAIDPDGSVRDGASPQLGKVRQQLRSKRKALITFLEKLMAERECGDGGVTVRGDRFVVPVRRDDRQRVRGIVHGESSSGGTLFVEPQEAVEFGNELSRLTAEEAREVLAVLRHLTDLLRPHGEAIALGLAMCVRLDDLAARARLALAYDGHEPQVVTTQALRITRGVHPLLATAGTSPPIPFDLAMTDGEHVLVVSGPNAGGKTVLLKSVGLLCCLAQSGIIPPTGPGTQLPVFHRIFVDIGDHQSLTASLSSFSAHLTKLKHVLAEADQQSLVLLDEIGGGTDPVEGAALAGSTLLQLNARHSLTIATTHLSELKDLAARTSGILNGSLHFDVESLAPTYRFMKGRPGRSYGLAIARRLGLPHTLLAQAEALQPHGARQTDAMLADLERREEQLACREEKAGQDEARLSGETRALEALKNSLEDVETQLRARERELEREGRELSRRFLLEARQRVEEAITLARAAPDETAAKSARRHVEDGVSQQADALAKLQREGWRVTGKTGKETAVSGPSVPRGAPARTIRPGARGRSPSHRSGNGTDIEAQTEVNLRGMTGDDAASALIRALDSAIAAEVPFVRIIHGKGTGALRARVTEVLRGDRRVARFSVAPPHQGGNGVTIAELQ